MSVLLLFFSFDAILVAFLPCVYFGKDTLETTERSCHCWAKFNATTDFVFVKVYLLFVPLLWKSLVPLNLASFLINEVPFSNPSNFQRPPYPNPGLALGVVAAEQGVWCCGARVERHFYPPGGQLVSPSCVKIFVLCFQFLWLFSSKLVIVCSQMSKRKNFPFFWCTWDRRSDWLRDARTDGAFVWISKRQF